MKPSGIYVEAVVGIESNDGYKMVLIQELLVQRDECAELSVGIRYRVVKMMGYAGD